MVSTVLLGLIAIELGIIAWDIRKRRHEIASPFMSSEEFLRKILLSLKENAAEATK